MLTFAALKKVVQSTVTVDFVALRLYLRLKESIEIHFAERYALEHATWTWRWNV